MGEFADHIFPDRNDELYSVGLRYRGTQPPEYKVPSLTCTTYSDETGLSAAIEYVNYGNGNETIPVFVTKAGNKVYIPPSIADLLRDKPPFKSVGPKLVPFLKTLGLYFVIFIPDDRPSLFAMLLKCLPIISLALFIVLHGIGLSEEHKFSRRILTGLVFSCLGDAFLIWPSYFLHGMAAFAVAQESSSHHQPQYAHVSSLLKAKMKKSNNESLYKM